MDLETNQHIQIVIFNRLLTYNKTKAKPITQL